MDEAGLDDRMLAPPDRAHRLDDQEGAPQPGLLQASRKRRIAAGAGLEVQELNRLLKMHRQMADTMKKIGGMGKKGLLRGGLGALFGKGGAAGMPRACPASRCRARCRPAWRCRPASPASAARNDRDPRPRHRAADAARAEPRRLRALRRLLRLRAQRLGGRPDPRALAWAEFAAAAGGWVLHGFGPFSVEERSRGGYLGEVGLFQPPHYPEPEIGWILTADAEGRGVAEEAARTVRAEAHA